MFLLKVQVPPPPNTVPRVSNRGLLAVFIVKKYAKHKDVREVPPVAWLRVRHHPHRQFLLGGGFVSGEER